MSLYPYYSRYYDWPYYSRYSPYWYDRYDPYYYPRYPYYSRYYPSSTSYVTYDSPTKTEIKDVSPGKVTTTTVDKSPVSPALDRTTRIESCIKEATKAFDINTTTSLGLIFS